MRKYLLFLCFMFPTSMAKASYLISLQERQVPKEVIKVVKDSLKKCGLKYPQVQRITYAEHEIGTAFSAFLHFYTYEYNGFSLEVQTQHDIHHEDELILGITIHGIRCP